jgi:dTDP-4-dehydrorhamnose 3,5-epimerase
LTRTELAGDERYVRLTVPPGIWFGFKGLGNKDSMVLNIASVPHDPGEVERRPRADFDYVWK